MREKEQADERGLRKRFADRYGMETMMRNRDLIIVRGQSGVTVYGCRKILLYSPCEIRLRVGKQIVSVTGERLFCTSFTCGTVTIQGCVMGVNYSRESTEQNSGSNC